MKKLFRKPTLFRYFLVTIIIIFLFVSLDAFSTTYVIKDKEGNVVKITNIYKLSLSEKEAGYTISVLINDTSSKDNFKSSPTSKRTNGVIGVIDGDTIDLFLFISASFIRIRLNGIDCPEKGQPFYEEATDYTSRFCLYKEVGVIKYDKDEYGRLIADIILPDGKNLSEELVRAGLAWWYYLYSDDLVLKQLENEARLDKRGLWSQPNPMPPWEFRKLDLANKLKKEGNNMKWLWTWGGKCFGYRDGDNLWTYDGYHIGKFRGDNVYGRDGRYLGEIKSDNRLITNKSKKNVVSSSFTPYANRVGYVKYIDYIGYVMYLGYEEFPSPEEIKSRYKL